MNVKLESIFNYYCFTFFFFYYKITFASHKQPPQLLQLSDTIKKKKLKRRNAKMWLLRWPL